MPAREALGSAAGVLEAISERIRSSVKPAESFVELKANNTVYTIAEIVDELARSIKRLHCIAEAAGVDGQVLPLCTSWRVYSVDGGVVLARIKPETIVRVEGGRLFFHRGNVRFEAEGTRVKLCKWGYCKEFNAANRREVVEELPQIIYLLRFISNAVRKTVDAVTLCARKEAPECARLY